MTVVYVVRYDVQPDKWETYLPWSLPAVKKVMAVKGVEKFSGYRVAAGPNQIVLNFEFPDFTTFAHWKSNEIVQKMLGDEIFKYTVNLSTELWGPSPVVPRPLEPIIPEHG